MDEIVSWPQSLWTRILVVVLCATLIPFCGAGLFFVVTEFEDLASEATVIGALAFVVFFATFFVLSIGALKIGATNLGDRGYSLRCTAEGLDIRSFMGGVLHIPWGDILDAELVEKRIPRTGVAILLVLTLRREIECYRALGMWERGLMKFNAWVLRAINAGRGRTVFEVNLNPVGADPKDVLKTVLAFQGRHAVRADGDAT